MAITRHAALGPALLAAALLAAGAAGQEAAAPAKPGLPRDPAAAIKDDEATPDRLPPPRDTAGEVPELPPTLLDPARAKPIDLPAALKLAGVENPQVMLARERVTEAVALRQYAVAQILPNINVGSNLDLHNGPLQQSNGNILKVNRGALYFGLGANAIAAGTVNIPGIQYNLNLSEAIFGGLLSRQEIRRREFESQAVKNDTFLRVCEAYLDLLEAEARRAVLLQTRAENAEVVRVTSAFARIGQGRPADANRARADLLQRDNEISRAESDVLTASARLCELLNLDPSIRLHVADAWAVPAPLVPEPIPLPELLAIALMQRPELAERRVEIRQALLSLSAAKVLPFSPNVLLGFSFGGFGGGSNLLAPGVVTPSGQVVTGPRFGNFDTRNDFDAVAYWTARNLGVGNVALIREAQSHVRSANLRQIETLNRVRTQVAEAYARSKARFEQIGTNEAATRTSQSAFREDLARTRGGQGLPIEVLDSLRLLRRSRVEYLDAIVAFNRAQFELYVSLGQPPADHLARPVPADLVPPPGPTVTEPGAPVVQSPEKTAKKNKGGPKADADGPGRP